jgi:thiol-disulfide isomerase/thioredoxin
MIRLRSKLFEATCFVFVLLGLPVGLRAQAPQAASASPKAGAANAHADADDKDLLHAVLMTREDVRELRRQVALLRRILESERGKYALESRGPNHPGLADGVYFFDARWCGPCQKMRPIVERLKREGLPVVDVNVDDRTDLRRGFGGIDSLPTFVLLIDSQEIERETGLQSEARLRELLAKIPSRMKTSKTSKPVQRGVSSAKTESNTVPASDAIAQQKAKAPHDPPTGPSGAPPPTSLVAQKIVWRYFEGNKSVSGERLAAELKSTPAYAWIGGKFDPANLAEDLVAVRKYYENLGFFDAKVTPTVEFSKDGKWIYLRYTVQEGPRYRIRNVSVMGNTRVSTDELRTMVKTHEGQFYDALTIKGDVESIAKKYDQVGGTSKVHSHLRHLEQPAEVDVMLEIIEDKLNDVSLQARAYLVADLLLPSPGNDESNVTKNFEKLIRLLTETIEPKTWDRAGGNGSITRYEPNLSLVIRQTPPVHRQVTAFLRGLRAKIAQQRLSKAETEFDKGTPPKTLNQAHGTVVTVQAVPQSLVPGVIGLVTNKDKPHDLRSYPVADLVLALPGSGKSNVGNHFEKLIGLVTDTVQPKSWEKAGGQGWIVRDERTLSLVILQTPTVHRQVLAFLRSLRSLRDWQVCLELTLLENPPADLLQGIATSGPSKGNKGPLPLNEEQRAKLLAAAGRNPTSNVLPVNVTMFYGTRGSVGFAQHANQKIDVEIADSTDRYAVNLRFGLHDNKTGKAMCDPVAVTVGNLKTVVIEFKPIGEGASARPSLLVVRPRLLLSLDEEEVKQ